MYTLDLAPFRLFARVLYDPYPSVISLLAVGQKNVNTEKANALKQTFKDARQAAYSYKSSYTFKIASGKLQAQCEEEIGMISLEGDVDYKHALFL